MKERKKFFSAKNLTGIAILLALVVVLQVWGSYIRIGATPLSFVLVPIVLCGMLFGPLAGGFLGFAFGAIVLIYGVAGLDGFTAILFNDHPVWTALLCLGKGTAAGVSAGLIFRAVGKKSTRAGAFAAAASAPIVNTGLFILGALLFLRDTLSANFVSGGSTVIYFLIIGCAGVNFLVEFAINLVCAPALYTVVRAVSKGKIK